MNNDDGQTIERFIGELVAVFEKHGFGIGGCGCCGSPYITGTKIDALHIHSNGCFSYFDHAIGDTVTNYNEEQHE